MAGALIYWDPHWDVDGVPVGWWWTDDRSAYQQRTKGWASIQFNEKPVYGLETIQALSIEANPNDNTIRALVLHGGDGWKYDGTDWIQESDISQGMVLDDLYQALILHRPSDWRAFGFVVGTDWEDPNDPPVVAAVKMMVSCTTGQVVVDLVQQVIAMMQSSLEYYTVFGMHTQADVTSVELNPNGAVSIADCSRAWRIDQPEENILESYDPATKTADLTATVVADTDLMFGCMVRPGVYVMIGRDSYELKPAPAVYLERVAVQPRTAISNDGLAADSTAPNGYKLTRVRMADVTMEFAYFARRAQEVLGIQETLRAWVANHPQIRFDNLGQFCDIMIEDDGEVRPTETSENVVAGGPLRIRISNVIIPERDAEPVPVIRRTQWHSDVLV